MYHRIVDRPSAGPAPLHSGLVVAACLLLALAIGIAGCGGNSTAGTTSTTATGSGTSVAQVTSTTEDLSKMTGTQLGEAIAAAWADAVKQVAALLDDQPDPADVQDQVKALKQQYADRIAAYGKQLKSLDDAAQSDAAAAQTTAIKAAANAEWYTNYLDIYDSYKQVSDDDVDFLNLVGSFDNLTDYAK